jgi:hypothetical protein
MRRGRGRPRKQSGNTPPIRRVADPFETEDDGANCRRCGRDHRGVRNARHYLKCRKMTHRITLDDLPVSLPSAQRKVGTTSSGASTSPAFARERWERATSEGIPSSGSISFAAASRDPRTNCGLRGARRYQRSVRGRHAEPRGKHALRIHIRVGVLAGGERSVLVVSRPAASSWTTAETTSRCQSACSKRSNRLRRRLR